MDEGKLLYEMLRELIKRKEITSYNNFYINKETEKITITYNWYVEITVYFNMKLLNENNVKEIASALNKVCKLKMKEIIEGEIL